MAPSAALSKGAVAEETTSVVTKIRQHARRDMRLLTSSDDSLHCSVADNCPQVASERPIPARVLEYLTRTRTQVYTACQGAGDQPCVGPGVGPCPEPVEGTRSG